MPVCVVPLHFLKTQLRSLACHSFPPQSPESVSTGPVLRYEVGTCSPARTDLVTATRAECWADPCSRPLTPHPAAWFHTAKMSCCGTKRASLVTCRNRTQQRMQLSPGATQHVSSRIMPASKSVNPTLAGSRLCSTPGFLSHGSKIGRRRHCAVSELWEVNRADPLPSSSSSSYGFSLYVFKFR